MTCTRKIGPYPCCSVVEGDCLELMKALPDGCVDAVITDPPYGIGAHKMTLGNGKRVVFRGSGEWDARPADVIPFSVLPIPVIIWGGNYFDLPPSRCWLVWDKGTGDNDYADCELAWTNRDAVVKKYFRSWVGANAKETWEPDRYHPTQKPVGLMEWCIKQAGEPEIILDPYGGAGTLGVAAKRLGKHFLIFELSPEYCAIARKRIALVEAQPNLFQPKAEQLNLEGL
jgi:DNA modification methylase